MLLISPHSVVFHRAQDRHVLQVVSMLVRLLLRQVKTPRAVNAAESEGEDKDAKGVDHE